MNEQESGRSERPQRVRWVDIHCHCLPGLDDGPDSMEEAVELCKALVADGVGEVIATPHQLGRFEEKVSAASIKQRTEHLNARLEREGIPLVVYPGADVRLDERLEQLLASGEVMTLAGSRYVLLEIPHEVFVDPTEVIRRLCRRGYIPIVSHPERHRHVSRNPSTVDRWLSEGALLQITAGSLTGAFGAEPRKSAFRWIRQGKVAFVASDAHNTKERAPAFTEAALQIAGTVGADGLVLLFQGNPRCVVENREPAGVVW